MHTSRPYLVSFFSLLFCLVVTTTACPAPNEAAKVRTVVARGVKVSPASVAWSPDGGKILYLASDARILEISSGKITPLQIQDPFFAVWPSKGPILVLYGGRGELRLCEVDPSGVVTREVPLSGSPDAAFPLRDGSVLLISTDGVKVSFGTEISMSLDILEKSGELRNIYRFNRIISLKTLKQELIRGWVGAGPNPVDESLMIFEQVKPPVLEPFTKLWRLDTSTGGVSQIQAEEHKRRYVSMSWSPDGRKTALSMLSGGAEILDLDSPAFSEIPGSGTYPSWNPSGNTIFLGGLFYDLSGRELKRNMPVCAGCLGFWSPDGGRLAFLDEGGILTLFETPDLQATSPAAEPRDLAAKFDVLKDLLKSGLISKPEYEEQSGKLWKKKGEEKQ